MSYFRPVGFTIIDGNPCLKVVSEWGGCVDGHRKDGIRDECKNNVVVPYCWGHVVYEMNPINIVSTEPTRHSFCNEWTHKGILSQQSVEQRQKAFQAVADLAIPIQ